MASNIVNAIWDALAMGKKDVLSIASISVFDWKASHAQFGSVAHAILFGRLVDENGYDEVDGDDEEADENGKRYYLDIITDNAEGARQRLDMLKLALEHGASPYIVAPSSCDGLRYFSCGSGDAMVKTNVVSFAGKTAVECLLAIERVIKGMDEYEKDWSREMTNLSKALNILFQTHSSGASKVLIHEPILDMWARVLANSGTSDVVISVQRNGDGVGRPSETGEVHAHRAVLCEASPVLGAMLAGSMREGAQQRITLDDCSLAATKMLLSLLYTGSIPGEDEPTVATMLDALMLGHRWQIQHVIDMLVSAIATRLDFEHFEAVTAVALRLQVVEFVSACTAFIAGHADEMQAKLGKKGKLGFTDPAVIAEVHRTLKTKGIAQEMPKKRRRII